MTGRRYRGGVHIRFDVPADPGYPARVADVLSRVRLRRYTVIGGWLAGAGVIGLVATRLSDWADRVESFSVAMVVGGVLSMLYAPWVRFMARRRSGGYAIEGDYEITDDNILMRSGSEEGGIAWDGVTHVQELDRFWVVFVGRVPATVIPQQFMSEKDDKALRKFLGDREMVQGR